MKNISCRQHLTEIVNEYLSTHDSRSNPDFDEKMEFSHFDLEITLGQIRKSTISLNSHFKQQQPPSVRNGML